ncbi:ribosomal protein S5 domain 2-like protein [Perkinsela sp. CCAP 1560/4]|nr:ribosomal protein S5 domain 2-like protein [Perkinsela sp. CCAP 1560/4]|eukprot:KNH06095.1 ribosomal protein S5 domain 2-like protein [Perkinsela sp. CCAP 1560/4]
MHEELGGCIAVRPVIRVLGGDALGSAYVQAPGCQVTVGVFGPRQIPAGDVRTEAKINVKVKFDGSGAVLNGDDIVDSDKNQPSDTCRFLADSVHQALCSVLILERQGILQYDVVIVCHTEFDLLFGFDAVLTASGLACADAGLQMTDLIGSTTVLFSPSRGPDSDSMREEKNEPSTPEGILRVVSTTNTKELVLLSFTGSGWTSQSQNVDFRDSQCSRGTLCTSSKVYPEEINVEEAIKLCVLKNSEIRQVLTKCFDGCAEEL